MGRIMASATTAVATRKVAGRRPLHFETIGEVLAEVNRLADAEREGRLKRLGHWTLGQTLGHLAGWAEYRDALEVLKKTEQDVLPQIEDVEDRRELEELCREVRRAMGSGDRKKMEEVAGALNDRLLNYAYLL